MSELQNVQHLIDEAKRAADAGELASAAALLQDVAAIQESELGPLHPELANTLNNLGIVAESQGQLGEAETYYRKAVAITSASLSPDDPIVASSRKNLEDFCRERGVPFEPVVAAPPISRTEHPSERVADDWAAGNAEPPVPLPAVAHAERAAQISTPASHTQSVAGPRKGDADRLPPSPASATSSRLLPIAIGVVVLVAVALLVMRPWATRESPAQGLTGEPAAPQAVEPEPTRAAPGPAPTGRPRDDKSSATAPIRSADGMTLVTSQLCKTFSAGNNWRCDRAEQSVAPGPIVLYTRVKSPRQTVVIHRWYRGDALRKSARLTVLANATEGYRTYSRQTVKSGENWRVEVTNTAGDVLYEQRLSVR